jgi:hypothetical protein
MLRWPHHILQTLKKTSKYLNLNYEAYVTKPYSTNPLNEDDLKIVKVEYLSTQKIGSYSTLSLVNHILQIHKMKTTFKGWWPQNIKSGISQKPSTWSYLNVKQKLRSPNNILQILKMKTTSKGPYYVTIV